MRNLAIITSLVAVAPIAQSLAAPCTVPGNEDAFKWETPLSVNEIYPSHPPGNSQVDIDHWEFANQRIYYSRLYQDTPEDACTLYAKRYSPSSGWTPAQRDLTQVFDVKHEPTIKLCAFDCYGHDGQGDGKVDSDDVSACGVQINEQTTLETEAMCDRAVDLDKTPYGYMDTPFRKYVRGADFTSSQKKKFKNANSTKTIIAPDGTLLRIFNSDVYDIADPPIDEQYLIGTPGQDASAEVDHLVPRTDKFGCGCGTNAPSNALLISRKLNNSMSNNSQNKNRKVILNYFAPVSTPAIVPGTQPDGSDAVEDDASVESDPNAAGCSAGGSNLGGFGFGAVALGLTQLARRRRRRN